MVKMCLRQKYQILIWLGRLIVMHIFVKLAE